MLLQCAGCGNAIIYGIISDLEGVAYRGEQPIPESVQAFQTWHARDVPYAFVTNNSTKSAAPFAAAVPIVVGKPQPLTIEQAFACLGTTKSETVMIGDQIGTDVAAGQSVGLRSILVASDVPFNVVTGITPDRIVSNLLDLADGFAAEAAVP